MLVVCVLFAAWAELPQSHRVSVDLVKEVGRQVIEETPDPKPGAVVSMIAARRHARLRSWKHLCRRPNPDPNRNPNPESHPLNPGRTDARTWPRRSSDGLSGGLPDGSTSRRVISMSSPASSSIPFRDDEDAAEAWNRNYNSASPATSVADRNNTSSPGPGAVHHEATRGYPGLRILVIDQCSGARRLHGRRKRMMRSHRHRARDRL